ncbi:phytoene/squalene synthase family protein [Rubrolithibacter danxiaensis]|uniref:phytoene/squalene synthase family protein n=1 Tax=Rubrolithibacter danxiaensis TaxID=3390805 RepID=UPI003BF7A4FC
MMDLYNETCFECSKVITGKYSSSFSLGIKAFDKKYHAPIYAIYGFVRYADEIVDTFHSFNKKELLRDFRIRTFQAIDEKISLNPVLHSFQLVVNTYNIDKALIGGFLDSMEMDLDQKALSEESYKQYIHGSAEVVGLMCLKVFCHQKEHLYQSLCEQARKLGSAFQKVNFLRDVKADFEERGRVYFPGIDFHTFSNEDKLKIEQEIEQDFEDALAGIRNLPAGVRKGVYIAYMYYKELFRKIQNISAENIVKERIRISDKRKVFLFALALVQNRFKGI